jgi:hypothetical protein
MLVINYFRIDSDMKFDPKYKTEIIRDKYILFAENLIIWQFRKFTFNL